MEATSSYDVNDLPAVERQALEGMLGQRLALDQRVMIVAYTPGATPDESVREAIRAGLQNTFEKVDQFVFEHGVLPKDVEAAIDESLQHFRQTPLSALIDARGRIVGTRITVYDVLTYAADASCPSSIAATLGIGTAQVQAAFRYFAENREEVLKNYRAALARIARGNPPEVEARRRQSHDRLMEKLHEIERNRRGA